MTIAIESSGVQQSLSHAKMTALCSMFPTLRHAAGVEPWDQQRFADWASEGKSRAESQAAAFVLSVWNGACEVQRDRPWFNVKPFHVPRFDAVLAMQLWDHAHQRAFLAWCENPFWP